MTGRSEARGEAAAARWLLSRNSEYHQRMARFRFADFALDLDRRELVRGETPLPLSGKAFALLELFVGNESRAISKEEIYRVLWGDTFVDEANIANLVFELRTALGDEKKNPRFIKTIHRFGYRFEAPVQVERGSGTRSRFFIEWKSREFHLVRGANVLGREPGAGIKIDASAVSRRHAVITIDEEGATLEDLGSKNGSYVADERITSPVRLRDGDTFRLGSVPLTLRVVSESGTTMTEAE